jgi:hypothetical protein
MNTPADLTAVPQNDRAILSVRILTWVGAALFLPAFLLVPRGITVFWSTYLLFFGPAIAVDFAAIVGFMVCRLSHRQVSFAYLMISLAVLGGVWYVTWFELRLRWYEIFRWSGDQRAHFTQRRGRALVSC